MEIKIDKRVEVFDIETLSNAFTYTAINKDTKELVFFIIWNDVNQLPELIAHLNSIRGLIGFNNLNFDYPVIHYILKEQNYLLSLRTEDIARTIYQKAQEIISKEYSEIKETEVLIPQLDLFRIHHYDNKAKMTSLKKVEIAMEFENVQDMPIHHSEEIKDFEQILNILDYNKNDVEATLEFYYKTLDKIELRRGLLKKYNLKCLNYSDSKIGEKLTLKLYCEATNKEEDKVRKQRTRRKNFKFKECIPSYINFETPEFNELLDYLKGIEVDTLKESFAYSFDYKGLQIDLGTGGLHACIKAGVYETDENYVICDDDVASLYPSLAIANDLYPKHLGIEFKDVYENGIVKPRLEAKKNGDKVMADGFKLSANAVYGKSNSEYSFLYDPLYTLQTTLAGQLSLCMLCEMIYSIEGVKILQINTDGITTLLPREFTGRYAQIRQLWMEKTKLVLEQVNYSKMVIRDVNNYLAVDDKGKVKYKGTFKTNVEMRKDGEYHKSFSQGIVSVALSDFYTKGIAVEETVKKCTNIYEFCKTGNTTGKWWAETFDTDGIAIAKMQKNNRYYLSTDGNGFRKCTYKPNKETAVEELTSTEYEAGKLVTIFNRYVEKPFEEYNVDYQYYIDECYKIIHKIDGTEEREEIARKEKLQLIKREREETNFLKYCIDKKGTKKQIETYSRDWLIEKYGTPEER